MSCIGSGFAVGELAGDGLTGIGSCFVVGLDGLGAARWRIVAISSSAFLTSLPNLRVGIEDGGSRRIDTISSAA